MVAKREGCWYKSQGRIQGIDGSLCVHVAREPKERASESARKRTREGRASERNGRRATQTFRAHASLIVGVGNVLTREPERTPWP